MGPPETPGRTDMDRGASRSVFHPDGPTCLLFLVPPVGRFHFRNPGGGGVALRDRKMDVDPVGPGRLVSPAEPRGAGGQLGSGDLSDLPASLLPGQLVLALPGAHGMGSGLLGGRGDWRNF